MQRNRSMTKIEDYAFLSDTQTGALVSRDGCIDWLCFPRFDSRLVLPRSSVKPKMATGDFGLTRRSRKHTAVIAVKA